MTPTPTPNLPPTPTPTPTPTEVRPPYASPTVSGHAYPWDIVGDPGFADRVREAGLDSVTLAVSYHSTRAATPLHPRHRFVDARHSALYRPVRAGAWAGRRLVPSGAAWVEGRDPAAAAALALADAGIPVSAWLVLAHNSLLGTRYPDLAVTNCFGEPYPYALCPAQEEVREYCATLAAEALHDLPPDAVRGVSLESAGQLGAVHAGCHEKTDGAYTAAELRALSVCCCAACRAAWQAAGLDPDRVTGRLRGGQDLPAELGEVLLRVRHEAADALRGRVLDAVRTTLPGAEVTLHAHPDPWATGPSPGLTERAATDADALLVPCWPTGPESAELVWQAVASGLPVNAYVTALPPADPAALPAHVRRLRAAGATRLSLYHLGLLPRERLPLLAALAKEFRA
ncbi:hypothetical protein [Streptomyces sp. G1]|uniref:hypothetical protein n=1 Tax=Streptomyces sp. G1 TaxID=361572 RepID=UPI00202FCDE9|nr:hypothetical protein [Streptomyces sp. G1]MCM1969772.1 hypothetical protein [Streptomyces sp. G1]